MRLPKIPPSQDSIKKLLRESISDESVDALLPYIKIINDSYLHWDELLVDNRFRDQNHDHLWGLAKLLRDFNSRKIQIGSHSFHYVQTPVLEKDLHDLDMRVAGKIDIDAQVPNTNLQKKYLVNSLMEEAIASSQLEGATTTRIAAKQMLRENRRPRNHDEKMILNNYLTMMFIKDKTEKNQKLTLDLIKEIHRLMTKDTLERPSYEGTFRSDNDVKVLSKEDGVIIFDPPIDHSQLEPVLTEVCNFINNDSQRYYLHPFVKAIFLHYFLGFIHPFNDGNGRTARALFYWYLITQNYNYLEYVAISTAIKNAPAQYSRAYLYSESDGNDVTYFIKFNLHAINVAVASFEKYINKTKSENRRILDTIRQNPELNYRQADLLIELSKTDRSIAISEVQERYHITYQTARTDLLNLVARGYLHHHSSERKFLFTLDKEKCLK